MQKVKISRESNPVLDRTFVDHATLTVMASDNGGSMRRFQLSAVDVDKFIKTHIDSAIRKCLPMPWSVRQLQKCTELLEFMQNCARHSSICARDRWRICASDLSAKDDHFCDAFSRQHSKSCETSIIGAKCGEILSNLLKFAVILQNCLPMPWSVRRLHLNPQIDWCMNLSPIHARDRWRVWESEMSVEHDQFCDAFGFINSNRARRR